MSNSELNVSPLFLQLVLSLQSAAWYQLGKMMSPISGKIERDLEQAKVSIDLLAMLQEKTKGNLLEEEKRILDSTVYNLQMNYIEELEKDKKEKDKKEKDKKEEDKEKKKEEKPESEKAPDAESPLRGEEEDTAPEEESKST